MMYLPKADLYELLLTTGATVYQVRPKEITVFPCITFQIANNTVNADLNKEIGYQNIDINIDFWAKTSDVCSNLFAMTEEILRGGGYLLSSSLDVPDPEGYYHISARFTLVS